MKENLSTFRSQDFGEVRTYTTETNEVLFCLADVCRALELQAAAVMRRLGDDVISSHPILDSLGRTQQANFINEDGLYDVILDSRKPEARKFRKWVTSEVLPSIRKRGMYATDDTIDKMLESPDFGIKLLTELKKEREAKKQLQEQIEQDQPKVYFADTMMNSNSSILIKELSLYLTQNGYPIGQNKLFQWMRDNGYLYKQGECRNLPVQEYVDKGYFKVKKGSYINPKTQESVSVSTVKVTGKGQVYFLDLFRNKKCIIEKEII